MDWKRYPAFRLLLPFMSGLMAVMVHPYCTLIFLVPTLIPGGWHWKGLLLQCGIAAGGALIGHFHISQSVNVPIANQEKITHHLIAQEIKQTEKYTEITSRLLIRQNIKCLVKVEKSVAPEVFVGDTVLLFSTLKKPSQPKNPHAFNYAKYLQQQGILYTAYIKEDKSIIVLPKKSETLFSIAEKAQHFLANTLDKHMPEGPSCQIAKAIFLGQKGELSKERKRTFSRTGSMHVMAVSGLHVGILMWLLSALGGFILAGHRWKWLRLLFIIGGLWSYALITGAQPSVIRSSLMFSLVAVGIQLHRFSNIFNILYFSALINLIINPMNLFDIGFQFSHMAVLSILFFFPPLRRMFPEVEGWKAKLWDLICLSIAVQVLIMPLSAYYFHQIPLTFIPSNIIVIPLATLTLVLSIAIIGMSAISASLADALGFIQHGVISMADDLLFKLSALPWTCLEDVWIHQSVLLMTMVSSLLVLSWLYKGHRRALIAAGCLWFVAGTTHAAVVNYKAQTNGIYVYHDYPVSTIDVIWNGKCLSLSPIKSNTQEIDWSRGTNRSFLNGNKIIDVTKKQTVEDGKLRIEGGDIYVDNLSVFTAASNLQNGQDDPSIWIILNDKDWCNLKTDFDCPKRIIIGAGFKVNQVYWKAFAEAHDIDLHDINQHGFYHLPL